MYIDIGPASLVITGEKDSNPVEFDRSFLEEAVERILGEIGNCLPVLRQRAYRIKKTSGLPPVVANMVLAAKAVDEESLTPLAAVAGAVSDSLKGIIGPAKADLLMVNNGGDISILNRANRTLRIGLSDITGGKATPYVVTVKGIESFGVATSGFGGRSFTLGLADCATVIGSTGAIADAAATFVGNMTNVETNLVQRRRACEIDPLTDIPDEFVTVQIGELGSDHVKEALEAGRMAAERLKLAGIIYDAMILLKGKTVSTICGGGNIDVEVQNGY